MAGMSISGLSYLVHTQVQRLCSQASFNVWSILLVLVLFFHICKLIKRLLNQQDIRLTWYKGKHIFPPNWELQLIAIFSPKNDIVIIYLTSRHSKSDILSCVEHLSPCFYPCNGNQWSPKLFFKISPFVFQKNELNKGEKSCMFKD